MDDIRADFDRDKAKLTWPASLDGEIFIAGIWVGEKPRPVTVEVLAQVKTAAARQERENNRLAWRRFHERAAEYRGAKIALVPRRG